MATPDIKSQTFAAGQTIFSEGEPGFTLYVIRTGRVLVTQCNGSGVASMPNTTVAILGPGELLGEMAVASGEPRSATATAIVGTVMTVLPKELIDQRMEAADPILKLLLLTAFERLRALSVRSKNAA